MQLINIQWVKGDDLKNDFTTGQDERDTSMRCIIHIHTLMCFCPEDI